MYIFGYYICCNVFDCILTKYNQTHTTYTILLIQQLCTINTCLHNFLTNLHSLSLIHTCIYRLARYYRLSRKLDANWKYESSTASALVA